MGEEWPMRLLEVPAIRTILVVGVALVSTPALVLAAVLAMAISVDGPPSTVSGISGLVETLTAGRSQRGC